MRVDLSNFNQNTIETLKNQDETPKLGGLLSFASSDKGTANGKVDAYFNQGQIGDCALLSTVYSLSLTEKGSQAIKDAIKINKNWYGEIKSYDVHFAGVNETYHITQDELEEAKIYGNDGRLYSSGDDDVTVLELAMEKCFKESKDEKLRDLVDNYTTLNKEDKLNGVNPASVTYLFIGEQSDRVIKNDSSLKKRFIPCSTYNIKDANGENITFEAGNEYVARGVTKDYSYIYIENPNGSDDDIILNTDEFLSEVYLPNIDEANKKSLDILNDFDKNNDNSMLVFATTGVETVKDVNGEDVELFGPHAFCVADVEDGIVTLINPHDTSKELKIPQENLLSLETFQFFNLDFE